MTPTNDVSLEIQRRIQTANRCFFGLRKHLRSSHLSRQTKFTIHKTLIHPALLYGSETWVLTKREENQLLVFERKVLRTIFGPKIENGVYRRWYNHELEREFDSPNALNITKTTRLRYAGHMIRRPENQPQKAPFRAKPNGRRNQGRPKSRWLDGGNSDSLALGVRDWMHCAQYRKTCRDLLHISKYTVKNFHVKSLLSLLATVCSIVLTVNSQRKSIKSHTKQIKMQLFLTFYWFCWSFY
jgi:hypothetical protein